MRRRDVVVDLRAVPAQPTLTAVDRALNRWNGFPMHALPYDIRDDIDRWRATRGYVGKHDAEVQS